MQRWWSGILIGGIALAFSTAPVSAQGFPNPRGHVTDQAGVLSRPAIDLLEERLSALERDTSAEVAVVTIATLDGLAVDEYAVRLF
jgi:uncharacterized protein